MNFADALHEMVLDAPSGKTAKQLAEEMDYRYHDFMKMINRNEPKFKLATGEYAKLMKLCDSTEPVKALCHDMGGVFMLLPDVKDDSEIGIGTLNATKEFGEFAGVSVEALSDGTVDDGEVTKIVKEGFEAMEAINNVVQMALELRRKRQQMRGGHE